VSLIAKPFAPQDPVALPDQSWARSDLTFTFARIAREKGSEVYRVEALCAFHLDDPFRQAALSIFDTIIVP
jgi:hypothetical protein